MEIKRGTRAIILADELLPAENVENYAIFIKLYNDLLNGKNKYNVDWTNDYHKGNLNNIKDLINTIDEILSKVKPSNVLFISQSIYDDVIKYCDNVDAYFELMCKMRNRMICVSNLLLETFKLNNDRM